MVIATQNRRSTTARIPPGVADGPVPAADQPRLSREGVERELVRERAGGDPVSKLSPVVDLATVRALQDGVETIRVDDALIDYAMTVIEETRGTPRSRSACRRAACSPGTGPRRPPHSRAAATSSCPMTSRRSPCHASRIARAGTEPRLAHPCADRRGADHREIVNRVPSDLIWAVGAPPPSVAASAPAELHARGPADRHHVDRRRFAAINTGNNLLYLLLGWLLSFIIASGILSEMTLKRLVVERRPPPRVFAASRS